MPTHRCFTEVNWIDMSSRTPLEVTGTGTDPQASQEARGGSPNLYEKVMAGANTL